LEYLFDLERAVEAVETRVPFGRPAMKLVLSIASLYLLLFLTTRLAIDYFWPMARFLITLISDIRGNERSGILVPNQMVSLLAEVLAAATMGAAIAAISWAFSKLFDRIKRMEVAIDKYRSILWQPLGEAEKKALSTTLAALGKHSVQITAHENTDCAELASDIRDCFELAGWSVRKIPLTGTYASVGASGFCQTTKNGADALHRPVQDALLGAVRGPIVGLQGGPPSKPDMPDVSIVIGPKRIRYED
jgi:hypothetical protein